MANDIDIYIGLAAETTKRILAVIEAHGEATKASLVNAGLSKAQIEKGLAALRHEGRIAGVARGDRARVVWTAYVLKEAR